MSFPLNGYEKTLLFNIQTIQGGVRNYNSCFNFEIKMRLTVTIHWVFLSLNLLSSTRGISIQIYFLQQFSF